MARGTPRESDALRPRCYARTGGGYNQASRRVPTVATWHLTLDGHDGSDLGTAGLEGTWRQRLTSSARDGV
jgi:hypothetical protein